MFKHAHFGRSLAAGMAIGLAGFPAATQAAVFVTGGSDAPPPAVIAAPAHRLSPTAQAGFDWADAGIGAGGAIMLVGASAAGAVAIRRRRIFGVA